MKHATLIAVLGFCAIDASGAVAPDDGTITDGDEVVEILESANEYRVVEYEGVQTLEITRSLDGIDGFLEWKEYYEVIDPPFASMGFYLRRIPDDEVARRQAKANTGMSAEELSAGLKAYAASSVAVGAALEQEMAANSPFPFVQSGLFAGGGNIEGTCAMIAAVGDRTREGTASATEAYVYYTNPAVMMTENACFLKAAADIYGAENADASEEARAAAQAARAALAQIVYAGLVIINGSPAHHLLMDDVNIVETTEEGQTVTINKIERWIDAEHFDDVKVRMEGVIEGPALGSTGGQAVATMAANVDVQQYGDGSLRLAQRGGTQVREFYMERELSDFRDVPGSNLYEPYLETLRMGGMLDDAQRAELAEAQAQLAEFEQQLAEMPASQRQMMESMMGSQLEQMRSLVNTGTYETQIITKQIRVNVDFRFDDAPSVVKSPEDELLARIQRDLLALGYDPGNTDGVQSRETVTAIISFQRDNNMELTGEASPQLAGVLAAAVDAMN